MRVDTHLNFDPSNATHIFLPPGLGFSAWTTTEISTDVNGGKITDIKGSTSHHSHITLCHCTSNFCSSSILVLFSPDPPFILSCSNLDDFCCARMHSLGYPGYASLQQQRRGGNIQKRGNNGYPDTKQSVKIWSVIDQYPSFHHSKTPKSKHRKTKPEKINRLLLIFAPKVKRFPPLFTINYVMGERPIGSWARRGTHSCTSMMSEISGGSCVFMLFLISCLNFEANVWGCRDISGWSFVFVGTWLVYVWCT